MSDKTEQMAAQMFNVAVRTGYTCLFDILLEALDQAQAGKGQERHNMTGELDFSEQRMQTISQLIGSVKGMEYQAIKKLTEGLGRQRLEEQERDLLGAINYIAGIILYNRAERERADRTC